MESERYLINLICLLRANICNYTDERYSSEHGVFMIHPTSISPQAGMTATLLQGTLESALADETRTENILRERANVPEGVLTDRRSKDVYITPSDAITYGLVHAVREFSLPQGHQIFQI